MKQIGTITKNGYRSITKGKRIERIRKYEHRIVMEQYLGRELDIIEQIHHINGNKLDNRIENLEIVKRGEHQRIHALKTGLGKDRKGISPTNKINSIIISKIKKLRLSGKKLNEICKITKLSYPTVQKYAQDNRN